MTFTNTPVPPTIWSTVSGWLSAGWWQGIGSIAAIGSVAWGLWLSSSSRSTLADRARVFTRRAYDSHVGHAIRLLIAVGLLVYPFLHVAFRWPWPSLAVWALVFFVREVVKYYLNDVTFVNLSRIHATLNGTLAGTIDTLGSKILAKTGKVQKLNDDQAHELCMSLLARMKDQVMTALRLPENLDMRATLAVPLLAPGMQRPTELRVWCYDRPHHNRNWTILTLPAGNSTPQFGAPTAYATGKPSHIPDFWMITGQEGATTRKYRSVYSIPLFAGGPSGTVCGVVNIDATDPNVFDDSEVVERAMRLCAPILSIITMVIRFRKPGEAYVFLK